MADLSSPKINGREVLDKLLKEPEPILAPGAYDALSARLIEQAGFKAVYMTGFGTAASMIGRPDVGLVTMTEMVQNASRIVQAVNVPVIADSDTGYGNPINVIRTVKEYESVGVAAIHIEDQVFPKKCGHIEGKEVVPPEEMVEKIRAAVDTRTHKDFKIIARTDAIAVEGFDAAIERAKMYRNAGADILFIEAPRNMEEIEEIARVFRGTPLLFNWAEGGKTPPITYETLKELGFKIVIFPVSTLFAATKAIMTVLSEIKEKGTPMSVMDKLIKFNDFLDLIGLPEIRKLEQLYKTKEKSKTGP